MDDDWKRHVDRLHRDLVNRDDPAVWVTEADAVDASYRYPHLAVRGPVFGIAAQDPRVDDLWRVVKPVVDGTPQESRDSLNSLLWFRAKDETDDPRERRELLAAVAVLEREPVDEVEVLGVRYRVVRGDEFARCGDKGLEPPRPTDPEPPRPSWSDRRDTPSPDPGFVLDPAREDGFMAGAMKLALRGFVYTGSRFPSDVLRDSERAAADHPDVVLLPVGFSVAERRGRGWRPQGALMPTPHDARRMLHHAMTEFWPLLHDFTERERIRYQQAADSFKAAGRANEVLVGDKLFRVCRVERMVRCGPDGPEPPRPSDVDDQEPTKIHPTMLEDGTVLRD
ncbi:DUF5954 family protein [Streptomyces coeruleoprunus]|uniref:DUF5954 family protein n=1 Tax=Streptomyces coeruleoprunus TaxID=285563 RepID=A0ABV9XI10_9ACTN